MMLPDNPASWAEAGVALRDRGDFEGADQLLAGMVEKFPAFLGGAMLWADLAARRGDWATAAARWEVIRANHPQDPVGYTEGARASRQAGDPEAAEAIVTAARDLFPAQFGVAVVWGEAAMGAGRWAEAVRRWTIAQSQFPNEPLPMAECAAALRNAGDPIASHALLREAHARFPTADRPLHDLARLAETQENWDEAARLWRLYRDIMPSLWFAYTGEAQALRRLNRLDEAEAVLRAACHALPDSAPPIHDLARLAEERDNWTAATEHWSKYRAVSPNAWIGYTEAARSLRRLGRNQEARTLLTTGVARLPDEPQPLHDFARLAEDEGEWTAAAAAWATFQAKFPHTWFSFAGQAGALRRLGRMDEAEAVFRDAVTRFPSEPGPLSGLVDLLGAMGRWSDAIIAVDVALTRGPARPEWLTMRAELAVKLERPDDAFAAWRRMPDDTKDGRARKLSFACDIIRLDPVATHVTDLLIYLVSEPDTGDTGWTPRYALYWHAQVLNPQAPLTAFAAFFQNHPTLFAGTTHRLLWLAVLDIPPTLADLDELMAKVVTPGRFGLGSFLFSVYVLGARAAWRDAVLPRLAEHMRELAGDRSASLGTLLTLAVTSMYSHSPFWEAVTTLRGQQRDNGTADSILTRFLREIGEAERFSKAPAIRTGLDRPLRIALCVSGQLRGFRDAFPTWHASGVFEHDTTIFVHTWRDVGLNWLRNWGFFHFSHPATFAILTRPEGRQVLADHFPTLAKAAEGGMTAGAHADVAMLRDFYGTDHIGLEDDRLPPFLGRSNDWKMLYKIQRAHQLAAGAGTAFDLFVRIRPDLALDFHHPLDWHQLAFSSRHDRRLFMDSPVLFTAPDGKLKAGDQIAIGALGPMAAYAATVGFDPTEMMLVGAPSTHKAHETLGNALFAQGVMTSSIQGMGAKRLLNPAVLSPAQVAALVERDAAYAPDTDFVRQFLDACRLVGTRAC